MGVGETESSYTINLFLKKGNQNYLLIYPFEIPGEEKYTLQDYTTKILAKNPMKQKRDVCINLHDLSPKLKHMNIIVVINMKYDWTQFKHKKSHRMM